MNRTALIWIVLGIVVIAILASFAFNGPQTTEQEIEETATTTGQVIDRSVARTQAAAELTALQARIVAGETYTSLADDFAGVRANLSVAYNNAEGDAAQEWQEIRTDFDSFEASARAGTSNFLDELTRLIGRFSADVRVQSPGE